MNQSSFSNLDDRTADQVLREASILRQQQAGSLDQSDIENIRMGKQDQSLGLEDAKYAFTHAEQVVPKAQEWLREGSSA